MKAEELRLGNYINAKHIGSDYDIVKVNSITNHYIGWGKGNFAPSHMDIGFFQPIPLTEEILLKCGFRKVKNKDKEDLREYIGHTAQKARYAIFDTDIFITKVDKRGLLYRSIDCDFMVLFYHKSITIKYLHQLQNLYFALTGQELEINL